MIGRFILASLIAGMLAGLIMGGIQYVRLTPLVAEAEMYEKAQEAKEAPAAAPAASTAETPAKPACVENMPGMKMCNGDQPAWEPQEGFQKTALTTLSSIITGAGFALLLAGVSLLSGINITRSNAYLWGLCGFIAVSLAPAVGLPPEPPGMPVADLTARQIWWVATIVLTGLGMWLIAAKPKPWAPYAAIVAFVAPHIWGAPIAMPHETQVPPALAADFVANSLAANAIFWVLIGVFLAQAFHYLEKKHPAS